MIYQKLFQSQQYCKSNYTNRGLEKGDKKLCIDAIDSAFVPTLCTISIDQHSLAS